MLFVTPSHPQFCVSALHTFRDRQHPCCPRCCPHPATRYLLHTSPCSQPICPTDCSWDFGSHQCQAQLCFTLPLLHCAVSNHQEFIPGHITGTQQVSTPKHAPPGLEIQPQLATTGKGAGFTSSFASQLSSPHTTPSLCRPGENLMALGIPSLSSICSSLVLTLPGRLCHICWIGSMVFKTFLWQQIICFNSSSFHLCAH